MEKKKSPYPRGSRRYTQRENIDSISSINNNSPTIAKLKDTKVIPEDNWEQKATIPNKCMDDISDKVVQRIISYWDIHDLLRFCLINNQFKNQINKWSVFKKFFRLRNEFAFGFERQKIQNRLNTWINRANINRGPIKYNYRSVFTEDDSSINNGTITSNPKNGINSHNSNNSNNSNNEYKNDSNIKAIDYSKLNFGDLLKNNCDKLWKLSKKYSLTDKETTVIFTGWFSGKWQSIFTEQKSEKKELNLSNTDIKTGLQYLIPACKKFSSTAKLDLSANSFSFNHFHLITSLINNMSSKLLILNLSNNSLNDKCCRWLFNNWLNNKVIQSLNLSHNEISSEGLLYSKQFLSSTKTWSTLNFHHNIIGSNGVAYLTDSILYNVSIRTLNISYNGIQENGALILSDLLRINKKILSWFITGNYICDKGSNAIFKALNDGGKVSYVFMDDNNLTDKCALEISKIINYHPFLCSIDLKKNQLGDIGSSILIKGLSANSKIITLDLGNNKISVHGWIEIEKALTESVNWSCLKLDNNPLGKSSGKVWQSLVEKKMKMKFLSVSGCQLSECYESIFIGLLKNKFMNVIDVSNNNIGNKPEQFKSIIKLCQTNKTLNELILNSNGIVDSDITLWASALTNNKAIKKICLNTNKITNKALVDIISMIKKATALRYVEIEGNGFDEYARKEIEMILQNCSKVKK